MRSRLAIATALVAAVVVAASATAVPASPAGVAGQFTPIVLPLADRGATPPVRTSEPLDALLAPALSPTLGEPGAAPVPTLLPRNQPAPTARVVRKQPPAPRTNHALRGSASWYCNSDGSRARTSPCHNRYPDTGGFNGYAAAGPALRAALGGGDRWRGRVVYVDGVRVKLVDWCQCYAGQSNEKLIDLYYDVFRRTGSSVTIRW